MKREEKKKRRVERRRRRESKVRVEKGQEEKERKEEERKKEKRDEAQLATRKMIIKWVKMLHMKKAAALFSNRYETDEQARILLLTSTSIIRASSPLTVSNLRKFSSISLSLTFVSSSLLLEEEEEEEEEVEEEEKEEEEEVEVDDVGTRLAISSDRSFIISTICAF